MSRLSSLSSNPTLRTFAQGAAQSSVRAVAQFLAPAVDVPAVTGKFKKYTAKNRFKVPDTKRGVNGSAVKIGFAATDATYNCEPHALDFPIDNLEKMDDEGAVMNHIKYGATLVADVAGLDHEHTVITTALTAAGAGTDSNFTSASIDPVSVLDAAIMDVMKAAKNGAPVRVLFGATAWLRFKNNANVKARLVASKKGDVSAITLEAARSLLFAEPECMMSVMVEDTAAEGLPESINFLLDTAIIVFACSANPTTLDASFMKTFRLMGEWMKPGTYVREDGRGEVLKMDWTEDVQVTNTEAVKRINATNA